MKQIGIVALFLSVTTLSPMSPKSSGPKAEQQNRLKALRKQLPPLEIPEYSGKIDMVRAKEGLTFQNISDLAWDLRECKRDLAILTQLTLKQILPNVLRAAKANTKVNKGKVQKGRTRKPNRQQPRLRVPVEELLRVQEKFNTVTDFIDEVNDLTNTGNPGFLDSAESLYTSGWLGIFLEEFRDLFTTFYNLNERGLFPGHTSYFEYRNRQIDSAIHLLKQLDRKYQKR